MIFAFYLTVVLQRFSYEAALKNTPQTNVINCLKINNVLMNTGEPLLWFSDPPIRNMEII